MHVYAIQKMKILLLLLFLSWGCFAHDSHDYGLFDPRRNDDIGDHGQAYEAYRQDMKDYQDSLRRDRDNFYRDLERERDDFNRKLERENDRMERAREEQYRRIQGNY